MKKISHKIPFRRTLAIICAATIAMLQCAVLLTVEPVHGAGDITVNAKVSGVSEATSRSAAPELVDIEVGGETKKGCTVDSFVGSMGISTGNIDNFKVSGQSIHSGDYIVDNEAGGYDFVSNGAVIASGSVIDVEMKNTYWPIKDFKVNPSSVSLKKDDQKDLEVTYNWVDSFFEGAESSYLDVEWSCIGGSGSARLSSTKGNKTNITVTKTGTYTIKAKNLKKTGNEQSATTKDDGRKAEPGKKDISTLSISGITGTKENNNKPKPVVMDGNKTLSVGTDYTVEYNRDTKKGIGYVTIIANPNSSKYKNKVTKTFKLAKIEDKKENNKEIKRGDVTIKVKRGEKIKTNDSPSEIKEKLSVSVDNVPSPLKDSQWKLIEYDKNKDEATIRIEIEGYTSVEVTKTVKTSSTIRRYTGSNNSNNSFTIRRPNSASSSPSTGTTVPNVTYAPDRTITVKEVYLGEKIEDEPQTDPMDGTMTEPMDGTESTDYTDAMDVETPPLQFGPAAGSAAVAAAAAGAGAVGRIRRFKLDTATEAVEQVTNSEE